jgi:prepilin-type N-terminal cleavage/methylation domain-containing protein
MNNKGVTLVELIVVFVIIAIGATLATPTIGAWLPKYRIRGATRDIVSTMRDAQMRAVASNARFRVNFSAGEFGCPANSYILQQQNTLGGWDNNGACQTLPPGITINLVLDDDKAVFNPDCTCSSDTRTATLSYIKEGITKEQRVIRVRPSTGRVTAD